MNKHAAFRIPWSTSLQGGRGLKAGQALYTASLLPPWYLSFLGGWLLCTHHNPVSILVECFRQTFSSPLHVLIRRVQQWPVTWKRPAGTSLSENACKCLCIKSFSLWLWLQLPPESWLHIALHVHICPCIGSRNYSKTCVGYGLTLTLGMFTYYGMCGEGYIGLLHQHVLLSFWIIDLSPRMVCSIHSRCVQWYCQTHTG